MTRKTDAQILAEAKALDEAYAQAEAFDRAQAPTRTVWRINWDIPNACGTFPWVYETEREAQRAAADIEAENIASGVWDEDCSCEAVEAQEPIGFEDDGNEMGELRKAALNRGQP